jgi:hypothetical protein
MNKKNLLKKLYNNDKRLKGFDYKLILLFKTRKGMKRFHTELKDYKGIPDCKVLNFGLNYWFRTNKGINKEKYSSFNHLINGIKQAGKRKDLKLAGYEIKINKGFSKSRIILKEIV